MAVMEAAETLKSPVILNHAQVYENIMPLEVIGPIMIRAANEAKVPVCVHLDHGELIDYIKKALELGFTSIMYDGSSKFFEDNVNCTKRVVKLVRSYGSSVEAELGVIRGRETSGPFDMDIQDAYTDPFQAEQFVKEIGIDALAASFGTAYGFYIEEPKLDFVRIEQIHRLAKIPIVMHGGSGVSNEDYQEAISRGVRKINYYSYMSNAGVQAVKEIIEKEEIAYFHDLALAAV